MGIIGFYYNHQVMNKEGKHAIAVIRAHGQYFVFDPNFGLCYCNSDERFRNFIEEELLGTALDVVDAKGELQVNATILSVGDNLVISYKNKEGLFDNSMLKIKKGDTDVAISDDDKKKDSVVLNLNAEKFKAGDVLEITAGENTVKVNVVKKETEDTKPQE